MHFGPQTSHRLSDFLKPRNDTPDGDYVGSVTSIDAGQTTDGKPQIKVGVFFAATQKPHTYWYNINRDFIWALVKDLVTIGISGEIEIPDAMLTQAEPWVAPMREAMLNQMFNFQLKTNKNDYQNTSIRGRVQAPTAGGFVGGAAPQPTQVAPAQPAPSPQAAGNGFGTFGATTPGGDGNPWGGAPPMHPHTGPGQTMTPAGGAPPTGSVNVTDLFRSS